MKIDEISVGKTYEMAGNMLPRNIVDIVWHPAGGQFVREYREAHVEIVGKRGPRRAKESLWWIADNAVREITTTDTGSVT
jgi:hypothetical protein